MSTMPDKVITPEFRVSFPAVFEPRGIEGSEPKYSVTMLIPKTADITAIKNELKRAMDAMWPAPASRPKAFKHPVIRDGDAEKADVPGYAGHWFIKASSKKKPNLVDKNVQPIIDQNEFYAGCYARASILAYAYDNQFGKGLGLTLFNVQKLRDGEAFGGSSRPEDDFGMPSGMKGMVVSPVDNFDDIF